MDADGDISPKALSMSTARRLRGFVPVQTTRVALVFIRRSRKRSIRAVFDKALEQLGDALFQILNRGSDLGLNRSVVRTKNV